jgi:membrane dipeptidase
VTGRTGILLGLAVLVVVVFYFTTLPEVVDRALNRVDRHTPYSASRHATNLLEELFIADLHADSLLWNRDLTRQYRRGHVDIPRLIEGHVALQAFTVVTKVPWGLNYEVNDAASGDMLTPLIIAQRWPPRTWFSLTQRALYQASKLRDFAERSQGKLVIIESREGLDGYLARRRQDQDVTAGLLGVEGAHALDDDLANLDVLFAAGFRMVAPVHFFDNALGGSAHGRLKGGLTDMGRRMIRRMEDLGMLVDLAHASERTISDVLAMAKKPVVVSHTGVRATCDNLRNLTDEEIIGIARTGGVIGIGYWEEAVCGHSMRAIVDAIRHVVQVTSIDHVALGSDFDGAVKVPFDAAGMARLVEALLVAGFSEDDVVRIMGGNVLRVLHEVLPHASAP